LFIRQSDSPASLALPVHSCRRLSHLPHSLRSPPTTLRSPLTALRSPLTPSPLAISAPLLHIFYALFRSLLLFFPNLHLSPTSWSVLTVYTSCRVGLAVLIISYQHYLRSSLTAQDLESIPVISVFDQVQLPSHHSRSRSRWLQFTLTS
jgi:hypothetical protein